MSLEVGTCEQQCYEEEKIGRLAQRVASTQIDRWALGEIERKLLKSYVRKTYNT